MQEYVFDKEFVFNKIIESIDDLNIEEDFHYLKNDDNLLIYGNIVFTFKINYQDGKENINFTYPIEITKMINELDSLKDISLSIENFTYDIDENKIKFKIITRLKVDQDYFYSFQPSANEKINRQITGLLMRESKDKSETVSKEYLKKIESAIKNKDVELLTTPYDNLDVESDIILIKPDNDEELIQNFDNIEEVLPMDNVEEVTKTNNVEENDEADSIEVEIPIIEDAPTNNQVGEDNVLLKETLEETLLEDNENEIKEDVKSDELLKKELEQDNKKVKKEALLKETYKSLYFFYVMKKGEDIDTLINRFNLNKEALININKNKQFKENELIRIPK